MLRARADGGAMKPTEFFIGVVDLFAVLMPGAIAAGIALHFSQVHGIPMLVGLGVSELSGSAAWLAFFVGSYILGHLMFSVGAFIDRLPYFRKRASDRVSEIDPAAQGSRDAFKKAVAFLHLKYPGALAEVRRLEADAKFFRSLLVLLTLVVLRLLPDLGTREHVLGAAVAVVLSALSALCYAERREKAIVLAIRLRQASEAFVAG